MTKQEMIEQLEQIIPAVFAAEDKLRPQLKKIIKEHADDPTTAAELYCHLIADEIVNGTQE